MGDIDTYDKTVGIADPEVCPICGCHETIKEETDRECEYCLFEWDIDDTIEQIENKYESLWLDSNGCSIKECLYL